MTRITNNLLWAVYLALLAVLLPHTAWALVEHPYYGYEIISFGGGS